MTLNCKGRLIDLSTPKVMGILNHTPDSFYDGGKYRDKNAILKQTEKMLNDGATFIDVGGYSSRPGADYVTEEEELKRMLPLTRLLLDHFPDIILSIDTFRSKVASACLNAGAAIINDISAGKLDPNMLQTVAEYHAPYIMMHMRGNPQTMQQQTAYDNLLVDIIAYFSERIAAAKALGMIDLIIDPGFGFAKTLSQNYEILQNLDLFQTLEHPLLIGISRKSMIYKVLETDAKNALNGTTALHMASLMGGANILRVHDVKEAYECVKLAERLKPE
ncbi:dihydropteroate synthase [Zobellia galactanivorans]|uniref:dihydropteroate synthase n=1 Tax=Zobellia galactanivorans (strain DSM 12802 / CCUG 47099 / CIP 106680 / NCIMB 13871 / Dsij) TaxID=63186 RepID=UPI0026E240A1|nr:dihydropteroate synthase [Zobellia galactanivorans]MDO6810394.1 dihydropteroate synthase [Zobellia galactanivorans]